MNSRSPGFWNRLLSDGVPWDSPYLFNRAGLSDHSDRIIHISTVSNARFCVKDA
jgi:hypothetical protein